MKKVVENFGKYKGAASLIGLGVLVILGALIVESLVGHRAPEVTIKLVCEIGIALVSAGLVGIMLETQHWSHYFVEKLKEIVVGTDYVENLRFEQIELLHENVYAKKYGHDIKDEGSLYRFFKMKTLTELEIPYRENFSLKLNITAVGDKLVYEEELSYVCRSSKVTNQIQDTIYWSYDANDIQNAKIDSLELSFLADDGVHYSAKAFSGELNFSVEEPYCVWSYPLQQGYRRDKLSVTLKASYEGELGKLWGVILSYPLRNISKLSFTYPIDLKHQMVYFGIDENDLEKIEDTDGKYEITYSNWCLKQYGFAFQLSRRK